MDKIRVTIWNEFLHELENEEVKKLYPDGIHGALAKGLESAELSCRTATLREPEHGLGDEVLESTDVLIWWGHKAHDQVDDAIAAKVQQHVLSGMGLIVLHSGHYSKVFKRLMGTNCSLKWREADEKERLWNVEPAHPIMQGVGDYIELPEEEMYGERFDIPTPDKLLMVSWFQGGEVFRSACTWQRGHGRVFYFRPGHETYPTYHNAEILKVIGNACRWARRRVTVNTDHSPEIREALESVPNQGKEAII